MKKRKEHRDQLIHRITEYINKDTKLRNELDYINDYKKRVQLAMRLHRKDSRQRKA